MADWQVVVGSVDPDTDERLFFTVHEWKTVEAATARIIPTDRDPGAREACVVRFIDRFLSGGYIYAAADGSGFLALTGRAADAWRARIADLQRTYREGVVELDRLAGEGFGGAFEDLSEDMQDSVLERVSGRQKPGPITQQPTAAGATMALAAFDDGLTFFDALVAHTRQGFYGDPVYGGNRGRVGWSVIGFPGPISLRDTMDGTYHVREYFEQDYNWEQLIPHLKDSSP